MALTRPTQLPRWARTLLGVASSIITTPNPAKRDTGFDRGERPTAEHWNCLLGESYDALAWLFDLFNEASPGGRAQLSRALDVTGDITATTGATIGGPVSTGTLSVDGDIVTTGDVTSSGTVIAGVLSSGSLDTGPVTAGSVTATNLDVTLGSFSFSPARSMSFYAAGRDFEPMNGATAANVIHYSTHSEVRNSTAVALSNSGANARVRAPAGASITAVEVFCWNTDVDTAASVFVTVGAQVYTTAFHGVGSGIPGTVTPFGGFATTAITAGTLTIPANSPPSTASAWRAVGLASGTRQVPEDGWVSIAIVFQGNSNLAVDSAVITAVRVTCSVISLRPEV